MLIARNPLDNTYISAFDVKHMPPQAQPSKLLCPGLSPDGSPCSAAVTPAALDSDHKHPYFRVGRVTDHIADCTESSTRVNPPDNTTDRRGIKGKEAPRGPERRVQIELRHPEASAARAANNAPRTLKSHTGHHRAPAPRDHTRHMTLQCGIRKAALDYARGIISDTDTVSLGGKKGPARQFIYQAERLLYAPYNGHAIIAFGQLHSISQGTAPNTYFIRLCRPNGGPTKVSIMIGSEHYASLRPRIHLAKIEPSKWTLIACGTITGKTTDKRYLRPFDGLSLYLQRTSASGFDNLAQPRKSGPHSGGAPSRA